MQVTFYGPRSIPAPIRRAVIERDGMVCQRCGIAVTHTVAGEPHRPDAIHLDHVIPWATGGGHTLENLIVSCARCNLTRPTPRGAEVIRQSKVRLTIDYRNGTHYWPSGFTPPLVTNRDPRDLRSLNHICTVYDMVPIDLIRRILSGDVAAAASSSIRIEPPVLEAWDHFEKQWVREQQPLRREERRREERKRLRQAAPPPMFAPPPQERVDYWRRVIAEGRAARAARANP